MSIRGPLHHVLTAQIARERQRLAEQKERRQAQLVVARNASDSAALRHLVDGWYREAMAQRLAGEREVRDELVLRLRDQREGCWTALTRLARQVATSVRVAPFVGVQTQALMDDHAQRFDALTAQWSEVVLQTVEQATLRIETVHRRFPGSDPSHWPELDAGYAGGRPLAPSKLPPPEVIALHTSPARVLFSEDSLLAAHPESSDLPPGRRQWLFDKVRRAAEMGLAPAEEAPWDLVRSSWRAY